MALLLAAALFQIAALYFGQIVLWVPQIAPYYLFNTVYGILILPAVALLIAALVSWRRWLAPGVLLVVLASALLMAWQTPIAIASARYEVTHSPLLGLDEVGLYLEEHYRKGRILIDDTKGSPAEFTSGLDLKDFVVSGFRPYFENALKRPAQHVAWVVAYSGDLVSQDLTRNPGRLARFHVVWSRGALKVFQRN